MQILPYLLLCTVVSSGSINLHHQSRAKRFGMNEILPNRSNTLTSKVLIIGAGIAGLEAARLLQEHGIDTLIIEGRNRTGGRISSIRATNGLMLDLGARYIHGLYGSIPSGLLTNPLWDFARAANISICETGEHDFLGSYPPDKTTAIVQSWYAEFMVFLRDATRTASSSNISVASYANVFAQQKNFSAEQRVALMNAAYFTLSDREGAELDAVGAKNYLDLTTTHYGPEPVVCDTGYVTITDHLARNLTNIRLGQVVTDINYRSNVAEVFTRDGQIYRVDFVLVTVPLGVLKAKQIEFDPPLPQWKLNAIDRIGFGYYEKVILLWDRRWWNFTNFYFFRPSFQATEYRFWATANEWKGKPSITCFLTGHAVSSLKWTQSKEAIVHQVHDILQKMFSHLTIPSPTEVYMSDWNEDPFSRGSYAYISVNQTHDDALRLSEPVEGRLLFAGEATSTDLYGYTHGALLTARREVTRLLFVYELQSIPTPVTSQSTTSTSLDVLVLVSSLCLRFCFD